MSFDRFLLAVESRDLSQADKILIMRSPLAKLSSLVNTFFLKNVHLDPNFLQNESSQSSQIYLSPEKLRQMFTFSILQNFNF